MLASEPALRDEEAGSARKEPPWCLFLPSTVYCVPPCSALARSRGFSVGIQPTTEFLSRRLNAWIEKLFCEPSLPHIREIEKVLELAKGLDIPFQDWIAQDLFFVFAQKGLREWIEDYNRKPEDRGRLEVIHAVIRLGGQLGFNMSRYKVG